MSELRPAASAALFSGRSVLLIRRAFTPWAEHWSLPGGRLEPGETPEDCIRREVMEELGLAVIGPHLVETQDLPGFRLTVFAARLPVGAMPQPNEEIGDWHWQEAHAPLPEPHTDGLASILEKARWLLTTV